ncbi:unnamed protein product [Caretta caretta]
MQNLAYGDKPLVQIPGSSQLVGSSNRGVRGRGGTKRIYRTKRRSQEFLILFSVLKPMESVSAHTKASVQKKRIQKLQ